MRLFEIFYYALDVELRAGLQFELFDDLCDALRAGLYGGLYDGLFYRLRAGLRAGLQTKSGNQS